ncbi:hypothetical protein BDZ89DRAFT_1056984 [Hymenopellis radicata]|nr:hypothetical protein BDZ89DRAFT_1056984 [Hymenopellis radicata]
MAMYTPVTWSYVLIRLLFRFVLKIFYGTIVVENANLIPETGKACLLVTSVPESRRNMLRLTAKATQFGRRTFTSWLIESAGTVPLQRKRDHPDGSVDNSQVMAKLVDALALGDAVCLFPEGLSRYHPSLAPLRTGVARLASDVLNRMRTDPDFEIYIQNCSITYMHRQHFRSDVLVTFHPPLKYTPKENPELLEPVDFAQIRSVTANMHRQISSGTFDSPSWSLIRISKLAARIYSPLGTRMTLGDHVRVARAFLEAFKTVQNVSVDVSEDEGDDGELHAAVEAKHLLEDLKVYQDQLSAWGIKDDRIRRPLSRRKILYRMMIRLSWLLFLFTVSTPGLLLWLPIFATTFYAVHNFTKTGPIFDTWDEIAQYKLIYGLMSGIMVWFSAVACTFPIAFITIWAIPVLMWMTLRWLEDAISSFRAFTALYRLLMIGRPMLKKMCEERVSLHSRVMNLATRLELPSDPELHYAEKGGKEKGRIRGKWDSGKRYFSITRRRKRDWNETLRLYDKVDYPDDDLFASI